MHTATFKSVVVSSYHYLSRGFFDDSELNTNSNLNLRRVDLATLRTDPPPPPLTCCCSSIPFRAATVTHMRHLFLPHTPGTWRCVGYSAPFNAKVSIGGGIVIGNFHLLPVAHVPAKPTPPASPPSLDANPALVTDHHPRPATSLHPFIKEHYALEPRDECARTSSGRTPSGLGFITGAFAGVVVCQIVWLLISRSRGKAAWELFLARFARRSKRGGNAPDKRRHRRGQVSISQMKTNHSAALNISSGVFHLFSTVGDGGGLSHIFLYPKYCAPMIALCL